MLILISGAGNDPHALTVGLSPENPGQITWKLLVDYYYDGESIYIHSLPGRKINIMRANPHVCLQVDKIEDAYNWQCVIAFGAYEEICDMTRREQIMSAMFKRFPHLTLVESKAKTRSSEIIIFCIRIERISGVAERW